jgi:hypothetical protein
MPTPTPAPTPTPVRPTPEGQTPQVPSFDVTTPGADVGARVPVDAFAQAGEAGTQPAASYNPNVFGDLIGLSGTRNLLLPGKVSGTAFQPVQVRVPVASRGAFKIADNENARPADRVYFGYNFYSDVNRRINSPLVPNADVHRETLGFEKAFLDGGASFGLRLPYNQLSGDTAFEDAHIGDLSAIVKYAFVNDRRTGNVLSGGLVVTAPTGEDFPIAGQSPLHSTILQPFLGYVYNFDNFYLQGFSSLAVPTDARDVTFFFNDVAFGYWLVRNDGRDGRTGIVPTLELHVNTPLNHRGALVTPIGFSDQVNVTGGVHFLLPRVIIGAAVGTPLVGPKPYDVEAICTLNYRF